MAFLTAIDEVLKINFLAQVNLVVDYSKLGW